MSRGFVCTLFGIAVTIFAWFSPWSWPAWPAFGAMALLFGTRFSFASLPFAVRGAFVVLFIAVNIAAWALAARLLWSAVQWAIACGDR